MIPGVYLQQFFWLHSFFRPFVFVSSFVLSFLQVIAAKEAGASAPGRNIDGSTFLYVRHKDMFFVAVTRSNSNAGK